VAVFGIAGRLDREIVQDAPSCEEKHKQDRIQEQYSLHVVTKIWRIWLGHYPENHRVWHWSVKRVAMWAEKSTESKSYLSGEQGTTIMISLTISPDLKSKIPNVAVGWITAAVSVAEHDDALWDEIETAASRFCGMSMEQARKYPPIKALRDAYRALGNDPTRYRGSNEALVRRITQGKDLYRVNTVVDINNLVTLETLYSAGTFDLNHLEPPIIFRIGQPDECYSGIGRGEIRLEHLPVFADLIGAVGSTTSDSERAMVRLQTVRILMVIISFGGQDRLRQAVDRAVGLLKRYAKATGVETGMVE
jgi:DNA/RNA-binding domain of Phe-tRNA-synthetase-like protein